MQASDTEHADREHPEDPEDPDPEDSEPAETLEPELAARPEFDPLPRAPEGLVWTNAELAWPLALVAGFLGAYAGIATSVPALSAVLAVLVFAPLYLVLLRRGHVRLAAVLAAGWVFAVGAAACAAVLDSSFADVALAVPGAWRFRDGELGPSIFPAEASAASSAGSRALRNGALLAAILLVARPSRGLLSLVGLAGIATAVGTGVGWFVELALAQGGEPALLALMAVPPHYAFLAVGGALLATVVADGRPLWMQAGMQTGTRLRSGAARELDPHRRQLLATGGLLVVLGLAFDPFLAARWGAWLYGAVR